MSLSITTIGLVKIAEENEYLDEEYIESSNNNGSRDNLAAFSSSSNPIWLNEATFDVTRPDAELTVSIWDRQSDSAYNMNELSLAENYDGNGSLAPFGPREQFMGRIRLRPARISGRLFDHWFRLAPRTWKERVKGEIRIQFMYTAIKVENDSSLPHFQF
jgi:hypothetical protein